MKRWEEHGVEVPKRRNIVKTVEINANGAWSMGVPYIVYSVCNVGTE